MHTHLFRHLLPAVLGAAVLFSAGPARADVTVYATADNGSADLFGTLDLDTGQFTQIASGSIIFGGLTDANGTIYGSDQATGDLYTVSTSGVATRYGTTALGSDSFNVGLTYSGGGFLATDSTSSDSIDLYSVAGDANSSSVIATLQTSPDFAPSGELAFGPGGALYFDDDPAADTSSPAELFLVDPATGARTAIGADLGSPVLSLVSTATTLYGVDTVDTSNIAIYTINTTTGVATQISTIFGLPAGYTLDTATVPEPSSWTLLLAGAGVLGLMLKIRSAHQANSAFCRESLLMNAWVDWDSNPEPTD
jgi:hypothetical protein